MIGQKVLVTTYRSKNWPCCNLCGTAEALINCNKCDSMLFCFSCDDSFHQHPKRRCHIRKSISSEKAKSSNQAAMTYPKTQHSSVNGINNQWNSQLAQCFNTPVPPLRRKKKLLMQNGQTKVLTTLSNFNYKNEDQNNEAANEPPALPLKKKWLLSNRNFSLNDLASPSNETKCYTQSPPIMRGAYSSPFNPNCYDFNSKSSKDDSFYGQPKLESRDLSFPEPSLKRSQSSYLSNGPWHMQQMPQMQLPVSYYYPYPFYYPPPSSFQPQNLMPSQPTNGRRSRKNSGAFSPIASTFQDVYDHRTNRKNSASAKSTNPFEYQYQSMHQPLIAQAEYNSDISGTDYCSGTEEDDHVEMFRDLNKSWSCKSCTFVNSADKGICEMCCKSYPGKLERSQGRKKSYSNFDQNKNQRLDEQFGFITESMIKEQIEIEKEMKRRLENERKIEKENRRLEKKQEKRRRRIISLNDDNKEIQMIVDSLKGNKSTERDQVVKKDIENTLDKLEKEIITNLTGLDEILSNEMKHQLVQNNLANKNDQFQKKPSLTNSTDKNVFVTSFHIEHSKSKEKCLVDHDHRDPLSNQIYPTTGDIKTSDSNSLSQNEQIKDDTVSQTDKKVSLAHSQLNVQQQAQLESGFEMLRMLSEAEDLGYTADDLEVALNFDPINTVQWLEENWQHMIETVMTLSNNQLLQNEKARGSKRPSILSMSIVNDREARAALRLTKGNIWQSIDKCVRRKEEEKFFDKNDVKSFSLDIHDSVKGQDNLAKSALMTNNLESQALDCVKVQIKTYEKNSSSDHDTKVAVLNREAPVENNSTLNQDASRVVDVDKIVEKNNSQKHLSKVDQAIKKSLEELEFSKIPKDTNKDHLVDHESIVNEHIKVLEKLRSKDDEKISDQLNQDNLIKPEHSKENLSDSMTSNKVTEIDCLNSKVDYVRSAYECELCANSFHISDMITMISCTHKSCIDCLRQYFTHSIREKSEVIIVCPFCKEPKIDLEDEDGLCDYLSLLDQQVKFVVSNELHELFQQKVRDRALSRDPDFKWCSSCSSGFIAPTPCAKTISCPDCKVVICALCNKVWEEQHFGISCEKFEEWKKANDPRFAEDKLNLHLEEFGIDCPNCNFHYELSKGGCMHFYCLKCGYDFCGGCQRPFKMGSKCTMSSNCDKLGFHSHHPRNCFFYLRDIEIGKLKHLLDLHEISYQSRNDDKSEDKCIIMEQKETINGFKDLPCGSKVETAGVCKQHYIEYLGGLIYKNKLDPIEIFSKEELIQVLKRENIKYSEEDDSDNYKETLIELIKTSSPL